VPSLTPAPSSSTTTQAAPDPTRGPTRGPTTTRPNNPPNNPPQNPPQNPPTTQPPPTTSPPPPADRTGPVIQRQVASPRQIYATYCERTPTTFSVGALVTDAASGVKSVVARYTFFGQTRQVTMTRNGNSYSAGIGPFGTDEGDFQIAVTIVATDGRRQYFIGRCRHRFVHRQVLRPG
jgi:hypothetical protein